MEAEKVAATLDALHQAASKAEEERYFSLYAEDAVFFGTDATERWTKEAFQAYAHPHFAKGKGWTYTVTERHIGLAPEGGRHPVAVSPRQAPRALFPRLLAECPIDRPQNWSQSFAQI